MWMASSTGWISVTFLSYFVFVNNMKEQETSLDLIVNEQSGIIFSFCRGQKCVLSQSLKLLTIKNTLSCMFLENANAMSIHVDTFYR